MAGTPSNALEITVHGAVQGVGFRYRCMWKATDLGLRGFARNEAQGHVTVHIEGAPHRVAAFLAWLRSGVQGASISRMEARPAGEQGYSDFEILG